MLSGGKLRVDKRRLLALSQVALLRNNAMAMTGSDSHEQDDVGLSRGLLR